jgi:hypothetical protein
MLIAVEIEKGLGKAVFSWHNCVVEAYCQLITERGPGDPRYSRPEGRRYKSGLALTLDP